MKIYALEVCAAIAFVMCLFFSSSVQFQVRCEEIYTDVLRIHVLANSDSEEDQELKLEVRDAILETGEECFSGCTDFQSATLKIEENLMLLLESANAVIAENGFDYEVQINIESVYFTTRSYDGFTLPAGYYQAVRVVIGEGEGENWWCVMFPALCLPSAEGELEIDDVLSGDEVEVVGSDPSFEVRFWVVEKYEEFKAWLEKE
ncbi:MAG: stage II sporulation protein R [Clostridia bacterium]